MVRGVCCVPDRRGDADQPGAGTLAGTEVGQETGDTQRAGGDPRPQGTGR